MKINLKISDMNVPAEAAAHEALKRIARKFDAAVPRSLPPLVRSACWAALRSASGGGLCGEGSAAARGLLVTAQAHSRSQWTVCVYAKQI